MTTTTLGSTDAGRSAAAGTAHRVAADVVAWPEFPDIVRELLSAVDQEADEEEVDPDAVRALRPWDLARLPSPALEETVRWLHQVARWLNVSYAWRPEQVIPPCWRKHPPLAHDLAVLAFGRYLAYETSTTAHPSRWHDDLGAFQARMLFALGENARDCRKGAHCERQSVTELATFERVSAGEGLD